MNTGPDHDKLYQIAEGQAGYFTAAQARDVGFSWERLSNSVKSGKFQRVTHSVYRLTHFPGSPYEDLFVAWLITSPHSIISHESALAVYELSDVLPGEVHVIVPRTASRRRRGIKLHTNRLDSDEVTTRSGIPVTTVARTIADVASSGLAEEHVRQAIQEALRRGLVSKHDLSIQAERRGGRVKKIALNVLQSEGSK
jgi:predicted transcriptional regulator of viral defense system